ncbi:MAG: hypothetical protein JSS69_13200 [Acidobacteria bacterium]|nr:hypothetical protein [Acidobacteriota bacterium]MBS1866865.1 hypothetical protein [Acidobacteriota bacterium]
MSIRLIPDDDKPYTAIEIALETPLPDYDIHDIEQPTPRDVDSILVSQGFRDLIDDARGILLELIAAPPELAGIEPGESSLAPLNITDHDPCHLELVQLTGAICPGREDDVYRPGLWIVIRDTRCKSGEPLPEPSRIRVEGIARQLMRRLEL